MNAGTLSELEVTLDHLSLDEQLWLMEQLVQRIRRNTSSSKKLDLVLEKMADDPEIQQELKQIELEFASTEWDGLGFD